ncbi:hypothetical protein PINS_up006605 [Pythium insidiosum]|nr:hypothetical protein PINS_up006605 [Pythium insidiosum]
MPRRPTRRLLTLLLAATVAVAAVSSQTSPPFPSDKPQPPKIPASLPSGGTGAIMASPLPTTVAPLDAPPLSLASAPEPTPAKSPTPSTKAPVSKAPKPKPTTAAPPAPSETSKALESLDTIPSMTEAPSTASSSAGSLSSSAASSSAVETPPPATKKPKPQKSKAPAKTASAAGSGDDNPELSGACVCSRLRRVSLMGAADYCLPAVAATGDKCGNVALAERGECPRAGAQPCQDTGHVLSNDSICAYDKRQDVYKCVASKDDLDIQHNGGKRPRARRSTNGSTAGASGEVPDASQESDGGRRARWSLVVATLVSAAVATALVV